MMDFLGELGADYATEDATKEKAVRIRKFSKGDVIFKQGEEGDAAYVVHRGCIAIFRETEGIKTPLATVRQSGLFGEMAVINGSPRMATAIATEDSILLKISAKSVSEKMEDADPFLKILVKLLMTNLRNVHDIYMPKPRTLNDIVSLLMRQKDAMKGLFEHKADQNLMEGLKSEIAAVGDRINMIRKLASEFADKEPRADAIPRP